MPALEIIALDTATPQLRAPGTGDTYVANRGVEIAPGAGVKALTLTGGTQTTSQPVIDATQTWNAAGVTFTGIKFNATDTASAAGSLLMDLQVGGASRFKVDKNGSLTGPATFEIISSSSTRLLIGSTLIYYVDASEIRVPNFGITFCTGASAATTEFSLLRDAAHTLAQRSGTNAQTFRIYNTFTDASNYERGKIAWSTNVLQIGTEKAGTGTARALEFQTDGTTRISVGTTGNVTFNSGGTMPITINDSSATLEFGRATLNYIRATNGGTLAIGTSTGSAVNQLEITSSNIALFSSVAGRLQFGGTTSSFPALKRNSTALETRLADDSAYAPHAMQYLDITDGITAPGSATGRARIYVDTADGDLKVVFADGTVKTIVVDT